MAVCKNCGKDVHPIQGACPECGATLAGTGVSLSAFGAAGTTSYAPGTQPGVPGAPISAYGSAPPDDAFAPTGALPELAAEPAVPTPATPPPSTLPGYAPGTQPGIPGAPISAYGSAPPDDAFAPSTDLPNSSGTAQLPGTSPAATAPSTTTSQPAAPTTFTPVAEGGSSSSALPNTYHSAGADSAPAPGITAPTGNLSYTAGAADNQNNSIGTGPLSGLLDEDTPAPAGVSTPPPAAGTAAGGQPAANSVQPAQNTAPATGYAPHHGAQPPPKTPPAPGAATSGWGLPSPRPGVPYGPMPGMPGYTGAPGGATPADGKKRKAKTKTKTPGGKPKQNPLPIVLSAVAVLVAAVLLWVLVLSPPGSDASTIKTILADRDTFATHYYAGDVDKDALILQNGTTLALGTNVYSYTVSADRTLAAYAVLATDTPPGTDPAAAAGSASADVFHLFLATSSGSQPVADGITSFRFSIWNKTLYYIQNGDLYWYRDGENQLLAPGVSTYAFASNDEYILYTTETAVGTVVPGLPPVEVAAVSGATALGISADGKQLFYALSAGGDETVIVHGKDGAERSVNVTPGTASGQAGVYFNYRGDQALVTGQNGVWRYTDKDGFSALSTGDGTYWDGVYALTGHYTDTLDVSVRLVDNFNYAVFSTGAADAQTLYACDTDGNLSTIATGVGSPDAYSPPVAVSQDGTAVAWLQGDALYHATLAKGKVSASQQVDTGVDRYDLPTNGRNLYYAKLADSSAVYSPYELLHWNPDSGNITSIQGDVFSYIISPDGSWCAYISGYDIENMSGALYQFQVGDTATTEVSLDATFLMGLGNDGALAYLSAGVPYGDEEEFAAWLLFQGKLYWYHGGENLLVSPNAIY